MTALASLATLASALLVVGVHNRFVQLRDDEGLFSPFDPMVRVAVVTTLTAAIGVGTALVLYLR